MKTVLITGATSGIGLEFAHYYGKRGYHLHLLGRNNQQLIELLNTYQKNCEIYLWNVDLQDDNQLNHFLNQVENTNFDIIINNAGLGDFSEFITSSKDKMEAMIRVNILALTKICRTLLPNMVKNKKGYLLNVGSVAGFMSGPNMAVYYASKNYVVNLSEALAYEVKDANVVVSCLCPGPVDTQFYTRSSLENSNLFKNLWVSKPKEIVEAAIVGLHQHKTLNIVGFSNKLFVFSTRLVPRKVVTSVVGFIQKHRQK